jgi:hypothetical protein
MNKLLISTLLAAAATWSAQATLFFGWTNGVNATFANGGIVSDNDYSGWTDSRIISGQSGTIQNLSVSVNLSGGWNGDLYAYLVNSSGGFAVLLDRVGFTGTGFGFGTAGMNVWLTDSGADPVIETAEFPTVGGSYSRLGYTGSLSSFLNPNGTWTLFIADLSGGSLSTVQNWGLQLDIVAIPEVETWIAAALAGAFGAFWLNRQIWKNVRKD